MIRQQDILKIVLVGLVSVALLRPTSAVAQQGTVRVTIVFDNYAYEESLDTAWGFGALIEYGTEMILFDTGGDGELLLNNLERLGVDPLDIDAIVLSHAHGDHIGGVDAVLDTGAQPTIYLLPSFLRRDKTHWAERTDVIEVTPGMQITSNMVSTGEIDFGRISEQALVISVDDGLIIITGCAHPGIVTVTEVATSLFEDQPVSLAMGGFHMIDTSEASIARSIEKLQMLGVQRVMPSHCTGDEAIAQFAEFFGEQYLEGGVGRVMLFEATVLSVD